MWYEFYYSATWAGLNSFLSGVLSLFSSTFSAMMAQPILVLFVSALLMALVFYLVREFFKASKK